MLIGFHHVQLAMPRGEEDVARGFYSALGLDEVAKPEALASRGGLWFRSGDLRLHLGVEEPFRPARKAHPAFEVSDLATVIAVLRGIGVSVVPDADLPGYDRVYVNDPFGNRIELLQRV